MDILECNSAEIYTPKTRASLKLKRILVEGYYPYNQWRSQDLRLGGARLKDNIKRKII